MRRAVLSAALILLGACAAPAPKPAARSAASIPPIPPVLPVPIARRAPQEPLEVKDPNFVLVVSESVPNPDADGISFTKVFVDNQEVGKTAVGRKSEERTLNLKLPVGNAPVRLEQWVLPDVGEWTRVDDALQPRERFVRVEDGTIVRLELHFTDGEGSNALTLSRAAVAR
ncbi:MAG: hypothetical protein ACHQ49_02205 [Elusimicrobiota bacterium]